MCVRVCACEHVRVSTTWGMKDANEVLSGPPPVPHRPQMPNEEESTRSRWSEVPSKPPRAPEPEWGVLLGVQSTGSKCLMLRGFSATLPGCIPGRLGYLLGCLGDGCCGALTVRPMSRSEASAWAKAAPPHSGTLRPPARLLVLESACTLFRFSTHSHNLLLVVVVFIIVLLLLYLLLPVPP